MSSGTHARAGQLEDLGGDQLGLRALAACLQQPDRAVRRPLAGFGLEQAALEVVQGVAGVRRVVLGPVVEQLVALGERLEQLDGRRPAGERRAAWLVGERDADLGVAGERLHGVALERRQIVEAVQEHRAAAPRGRAVAQRVERRPRQALGVDGPEPLEPPVVRGEQRGELRGMGRRLIPVRTARVKRAGPTSERPSSANSAPAAAANPGAAAERASTSSRVSSTAARTTRSRATGPSARAVTPVASAIPRTSHEKVTTSAPSTMPSAASSR